MYTPIPDCYAYHFGPGPSSEWNTEWARPEVFHYGGTDLEPTDVLICKDHDLPAVETVIKAGVMRRVCAFCVARSVPSPIGALMGAV